MLLPPRSTRAGLALLFSLGAAACAVTPTAAPSDGSPVDRESTLAVAMEAQRVVLAGLISESMQPGLLAHLTNSQLAALRSKLSRCREQLRLRLSEIDDSDANVPESRPAAIRALERALADFQTACRGDAGMVALDGYSAAFHRGDAVWSRLRALDAAFDTRDQTSAGDGSVTADQAPSLGSLLLRPTRDPAMSDWSPDRAPRRETPYRAPTAPRKSWHCVAHNATLPCAPIAPLSRTPC